MPPEPGYVIVAETEGAYRFVTQPDHAELAGVFAERWGNGPFEAPEPYAAVVLAAHDHDDGWRAYDRRPHLHDDGTPVDFREMSAGPWTALYDDGIEAVASVDAYAGLLVSMHGAGLRNRRYGLSPSWPETQPGFVEFVEREEARQAELARRIRDADDVHAGGDERDGDGDARLSGADQELLSTLHETGGPPDGSLARESRLWRNYRLLQAWDTLSLSFCTSVSPPSYPAIDSVPTGEAGSEATLSIEALGEGEFGVEPYPFDEEPLSVSVPARTVPKDAFEDETSLFRAYYGAERETVALALRRTR